MLSFFRKNDFAVRLRMVHDRLPKSAQLSGKQSCCKSGRCCWSGPCRLAPSDAPKIAAHLGITEAELFEQYLVVDDNPRDDAFMVMPRRKQDVGGHYLTDDETFNIDTPCVFLGEDNGCQIHEAKPTGGVWFRCWDESRRDKEPPGCDWTREQVMALGWDGWKESGDWSEDDDDQG